MMIICGENALLKNENNYWNVEHTLVHTHLRNFIIELFQQLNFDEILNYRLPSIYYLLM